ncbi:hypothetical protein [Terriglobus aquaticus]|nr:hypothetical protein [Terriglobus aquaticus]
MPLFTSVRKFFVAFVRSGRTVQRTRPNPKPKSLLSTVLDSEAKRHSANTCALVIEDTRAAIEADPNFSTLLKLHRLQRLELVESRMPHGDCAVWITVKPGELVGLLTGPDASGICEALRSRGEAWGRVLEVGDTENGTYRIDLILFWRNGPLAKTEVIPRNRAA